MRDNKDFEYEFIADFNIDDIDYGNKKAGRWVTVLREWEKTDNKTLKFALTNKRDKDSCSAGVRVYIKKNNLDWTVYCERNKHNVYVVRA